MGLVNIPPGEIIDRISILKVKSEMMPDLRSLLAEEVLPLYEALKDISQIRIAFYREKLYTLNLGQWAENEKIFKIEETGEPMKIKDTMEVCRAIFAAHRMNKERIEWKNKANAEFGSTIREAKSFARAV